MSGLVGQGYDVALNMSGQSRGVQARIQGEIETATYVHCKAHNLNLALVHACEVVKIRNMYDTVGQIFTFITGSPKRLQIYLDNAKGSNCPRVKRLCPTRWSQRLESVESILVCFEPIVHTLDDLQEDQDTKTRTNASALSRAMCSWDFILCLSITECLLKHTSGLCDSLQAENYDIVKAENHSSIVITTIQRKREDQAFNSIWAGAEQLAAKYDFVPSKPRTAGRQKHQENAPSQSSAEYWKFNAYLPFVDHLINQLSDRLASPSRVSKRNIYCLGLLPLSPLLCGRI